MCERAKDEPLVKFWWRQYAEDPAKALGFGSVVALCLVYYNGEQKAMEHREDMREQQAALISQMKSTEAAMREIAVKLSSCDTRLQHVEREVEAARKK